MNRIKILISLVFISLISCSEQEDTSEDTNIPNGFESVRFRESLNTSRVEIVNRTILPTVPEDFIPTSSTSNNKTASVTNQQPYFWTWVAQVKSPVVAGETLSATHCALTNNRAYVSYHKQGDSHLGSLEILDISDPSLPSQIMQIDFLEADINAVAVDAQENIWLAASHAKHGATVYKVNANTFTTKRINLSNSLQNGVSASANGIAFTQNYVLVSTGKTYGGHFRINKNNQEVDYLEAYSDAKYIASNGNSDTSDYAVLVTGDNAQIKTGRVNQSTPGSSYDVGNITHTNVQEAYRGKNTLTFDPYNRDRVFVSMAQNGFKTVDIRSGQTTHTSKGTMLLEGNTNAVTLDNTYLYIANGADGIAIADHPGSQSEIQPFFVWDMEEQPASANYVTAKDDWIFVCKGQGGFNILYRQEKAPYMTVSPYDDSGKPITMEPDEVICSTLLPNLFNTVLPERQNAITAHPEYFTHPAKNIHIKQEAEVKLTFVSEGAGYKNILGYYAYDINNPPQTVEDLVKVVIFPNASAQYSGGELIPGNTVKLLGRFPADTMIGFFVIADGWRNGEITEGFTTQHTDAFLNSNGQQQALIFHDRSCSSTIICFEDISVPNGDKDYNDAIFQIEASPATAIDTSDYFQIN
jgi:hypothetical protein